MGVIDNPPPRKKLEQLCKLEKFMIETLAAQKIDINVDTVQVLKKVITARPPKEKKRNLSFILSEEEKGKCVQCPGQVVCKLSTHIVSMVFLILIQLIRKKLFIGTVTAIFRKHSTNIISF